jgi:uncharacterized protein
MSEEVLNKIREFAREEFEKPEALYKPAFDNHFKIVVKYTLELADRQGADREIVEIAAWLHDIGSIMGHYKDHHVFGAKVAEKLLGELGYPKDKIEKVKHCILTHRGSLDLKRETVEAQILTDADAMACFDDIDGILTRVFCGDKKKTLAKLERSYAKLSDDSKVLIIDKLKQAREDLG